MIALSGCPGSFLDLGFLFAIMSPALFAANGQSSPEFMIISHHRIFQCALSCCLLAALTLLPLSAHATVMRYADVERLVEISDLIVHATVLDSQFTLDEAGQPWTYTTIGVHQTFMGEHQSELIIRQWGAHEGKRQGRITGDPDLVKDREIVVFLRRDEQIKDGPIETFALTALSQALFEIHYESGRRIIQRDLKGLAFVVTDNKGTRTVHHSEPPHMWETFLDILGPLVEARVDQNEQEPGGDARERRP